ncbi:hypothetical protein DSECCO2_504450 [anaerobic digester metagenome]
MNAIRSIESNDYGYGRKKDKYDEKEEKVKSILRQIFLKHGYDPIKFYNRRDGTDYGIDDVILKDEMPDDDPLNLSCLVNGRCSDLNYAIDYKSNDFNSNDGHDCGLKSVYIKLMSYRSINPYLPYTTFRGKRIKTVTKYQIKDDEQRKKELKIKDSRYHKKVTFMEKFYGNHYLLGDDNKTDYFFYAKCDDISENESSDREFELVSAYLVPAEQLRKQVINILNIILKAGGFNYPIKLREDSLYLNHKIRHALRIYKESNGLVQPGILKPPMDLFRSTKGGKPDNDDIILRIPENYLTPHIKFDSKGVIIN